MIPLLSKKKMKRLQKIQLGVLLAFVVLGQVTSRAQSIVSEGVLGNSGEAGASLVRFAGKFRDYRAYAANQGGPAEGGMGAAIDRYGFLWDRAGLGNLNRYAIDGRLIGQYPIPVQRKLTDQLTLVGDTLLLQTNGKLLTLSVNDPSGTAAKPLNIDSQAISFESYQGQVAALQGTKIVWVNPATAAVTDWMEAPPGRIIALEVLPDGSLAVQADRDMLLFNKDGMQKGKNVPGNSMQFLDGYWYGHLYHGTIKRFNAALEADPGVVLGGGSGSFIGKLEGNYELNMGVGMAKVAPDLFDVAGVGGVHHLLQWQEKDHRFEIVRRIGSAAACRALYIDDKGVVRYDVGAWKWSDGPASPQSLGSPIALCGPAAVLQNGTIVAPAMQYGSAPRMINIKNGDVFNPTDMREEAKFFGKGIIGSAAAKVDNKFWFLLLAADGSARRYQIGNNGDYLKQAADVSITTATPVKEWSGLAGTGDNTMLAAADGYVLELQRDGEGWKETKRWNNWPGDNFGKHINIAVDGGRLWVSDTNRHRVLCFSLAGEKLLGGYGTVDKAGDDLTLLSSPTVIAARGSRAVVYDSDNQRLVKLTLQ